MFHRLRPMMMNDQYRWNTEPNVNNAYGQASVLSFGLRKNELLEVEIALGIFKYSGKDRFCADVCSDYVTLISLPTS